MSDAYAVILRACAASAQAEVASFLGKAFSLKEATCTTIVSSAPIALLTGLNADEAAAMLLVLHGLRLNGVTVEISSNPAEDLPKIDWPRQPSVFKRDIAEYARDFRMPLACPSCGLEHPLLEYLNRRMTRPAGTSRVNPAADAGSTQRSRAQPFTGAQMPEITPFSNAALPATGTHSGTAISARVKNPAAAGGGGGAVEEAMAALDGLFPEEESQAIVPNNTEINSLLDSLLPDEGANVGGVSGANRVLPDSPSGAVPVQRASGFSLFLPRISDEQRRQKAVKLLTEIAKIPEKDADALSKRVIIPVLKGVSKEEAEAGRQKFAKIGIPARVMGSE